jgi:mono/diheme cytochrome c family protein
MKRIILSVALVASSLFAFSGGEVYSQYCASCHEMNMPKDEMLAPPMPNVSMRLQSAIGSKEEFVTFVKDYIQNPSQEKGHCRERAFKNFGVMPAIGLTMTEEERDAVATWLFENFERKVSRSTKSAQGKCGAGKCGNE